MLIIDQLSKLWLRYIYDHVAWGTLQKRFIYLFFKIISCKKNNNFNSI
jgi:hypothetical protein